MTIDRTRPPLPWPLPLVLLVVICSFCRPSEAVYGVIHPASNTANCITGSNGGDNAALTVTACGSPPTTYQQIIPIGSPPALTRFYTGQSTNCSYKCLDVSGGGVNSVLVTQEDCNPGSKTQYWTIADPPSGSPSGTNFIKNFATGRCLTAETLTGTFVDQYDCGSSYLSVSHQVWQINDDNTLFSQLSSGATGCTLKNQQVLGLIGCLKVTGGSPKGGAGTSCATCAATEWSQHFEYQMVYPQVLKITGALRCIDGGGSADTVYQYTCAPSALNHQWVTFNYPNDPVVSYSYYMDLLSGLCLTLSGSSVVTQPCADGNTNQQWIVQPYF